ncbi:DNA polymerase III subunit chi [Kaistia algarum]|uniref:DNA polymerase III subunit chi n=1 Tax=Kaistia algarum TaxID=2083279 RepID=UPI000CE74E33|nr:DNA polymerase III subunit chi [Kaistia algarum]MCX5511966.1 DNA polymerase III subunit chi [Kaistia algarum]PPE80097.1 DNA polymerase III subunit chi [Kaistia algarum]
MTEVLFYHLQQQPLESVLPPLLEKCLERGWRVVVEAGSPERCDSLDALLWTFREESFLPHGTWRDPNAAIQPIVLTADAANPNGARVRFAVDGADIGSAEGYDRLVLLFNGNDPESLDTARAAWRRVKGEGHDATYWQQSGNGRWEKRA